MIADKLDCFKMYESLNPGFATAGNFMREFYAQPKADGRYDLDGGVFANVSSYKTKPAEGGRFEAHRKYIDIQFMVSGSEIIGYAPTDFLKQEEPFGEGGDIAWFSGKSQADYELRAGCFMILFPQDGHMPCLMIDAPEQVTKIVLKVPV